MRSRGKPYELLDFQVAIMRSLDEAKEVVMDQYYARAVDIFLAGNKKNKLPNPALPRKMKKFYNCVATIMTFQLQSLCLNSLKDFVNYMLDVKVK